MFGSSGMNVPDYEKSQEYYSNQNQGGGSYGTRSSPMFSNDYQSQETTPQVGSNWGWLNGIGGVANDIGGLISTGTDLYSNYKNYNNLDQIGKNYQYYNDNNKMYANKLKDLINDPSSIKSNPAYTAGLKFSEDAINRKAAALGYTNSGNVLSQLSQNAQDYGTKFYDQEANRLASLARPDQNFMAAQNSAMQAKNSALPNIVNSGLNTMGYKPQSSTLDKVGGVVNTASKVADIVGKISKFF